MLQQPMCTCGHGHQPVLQEYYLIPDAWRQEIAPLLPTAQPKLTPGRPRMDDRQAMTAIFYFLRTGCQWNALTRCLGASSTVHDHCEIAALLAAQPGTVIRWANWYRAGGLTESCETAQ